LEKQYVFKIDRFIWKNTSLGFYSLVISIVALGGYFYYKSGQPMQVAKAQFLVPGITYRKFLWDRIEQWSEIDDQKAAQGKGRSCMIVPTLMLPMMYAGSIYEVIYLRMHHNTKEAAAFLRSISNIIPPDELIYGPWWKLPDAWWWQIENMSWWDYYRPLGRAVYCEVGAPRRPTREQ
jgi:hypothetical protein